MIDLKMIYIFCLGVFLSVLYYAEELIEEQAYKEKSILMILTLLIIKGSLGAILIILTFYTLSELKLSFTVFGKIISFGEWTNLFIAGVVSIFGSDFFRILKKRFEKTTIGDDK